MRARAASCNGQPSAIFRMPSAAIAVSASSVPDFALSQIGAWTATRRMQGATSTQVSREQSFTIWRSRCQAVGSPVTLPTMNPTTGQPIRQVKARTTE